MLEIEIKSHCEDLVSMREKVLSLGGTLRESRREADLYFNHPSRDFRITDEALRIRSVNGNTVITYKGPKLGTRSKTRFEEEVGVESYASIRTILLKLGFVEVREVRKDRELFLVGDIEVCLDRVEEVGDFVELEKKGEERERVEEELFALAGALGLSRFETRSYLEMVPGQAIPRPR